MLRMIRSVFGNSDTIDSVDSYESQSEGLLEEEIQRVGVLYPSMSSFRDGGESTPLTPYPVPDDFERTPSSAELEYYSDYSPAVGYRIAVSLGILVLLFAIFVLYKTHCHQKKIRRLVQGAHS